MNYDHVGTLDNTAEAVLKHVNTYMQRHYVPDRCVEDMISEAYTYAIEYAYDSIEICRALDRMRRRETKYEDTQKTYDFEDY